MKTFEVTLTIQIEAMHEESAENKLDSFLTVLDLKKNQSISLIEMSDIGDAAGAPKKANKKKEEPEDDEEWDESWEDADWDSLDEDEWDDDEEDEDDA